MGGGIIISTLCLTFGGIWFSSAYNTVKKLKSNVDEAFATMDIYLEKRYDIIPNLANIVEASGEADVQEAFEAVTKARDNAWNANSWHARFDGENAVTDALDSFLKAAEACPSLNSNKNFVKLKGQLEKAEESMENAKQYYNTIAKAYNAKLRTFPAFLYAKMLGFKKRPLFEASNAEKSRNNEK